MHSVHLLSALELNDVINGKRDQRGKTYAWAETTPASAIVAKVNFMIIVYLYLHEGRVGMYRLSL